MESSNIFTYLQRTILILLLPPSGLLLLILYGFLLLRAKHIKFGKILIFTGFLLLYLLGTNIVSNVLIRPIEYNAPFPEKSIPEASALVVLTGGVKDLSHLGLGSRPSLMSLARLSYGIQIYNASQGMPFIISGGRGDPAKPELSEGKSLGSVALAMGVNSNDIIIEDSSLNTFESAAYVQKILKGNERKIILVTSAFHMGRAKAFFENTGFTVIPAPTDYRGEKINLSIFSLIPSSDNYNNSTTAIYEYLTRLRYIHFS